MYEHNHVFLNRPFAAILNEELPERLAPADWLKKWTHEEIDAGTDIIVMHGVPLAHGVEIYHKRPIFCDLGNFIFNVPPVDIQLDEPIFWESVIAHVEFRGKNLQSITFQPIVMNKIGQGQPDLEDTSTRIISSSKLAAYKLAAYQSQRQATKQVISCSGWRTPHAPSEQKWK